MTPLGDGAERDFPNYPGMAPLPSNVTQGLQRPAEVRRSVVCWAVAAVLWLAGAVLGVVLGSRLTLEIVYGSSYLSSYDSQTGATRTVTEQLRTGPTFATMFVVLVVALWLVLVILLQAGLNWARVTLTVFGVGGVLAVLGQVITVLVSGQGQSVGTVIEMFTSVGAAVLSIVAIVSMYRHGAAWYFSGR